MEKCKWFFLAFLVMQFLASSSQETETDTSGWQSIDCGANANSIPSISDGDILWQLDDDYIQTGSKALVRTKTYRKEFNSLRAFPDKAKENCYNVSTGSQTIRYIIRVGFYYGNYDGLFKPPTFDLFINDVKWTTVDTSINNGEPIYKEIIYQNKKSGFFKICLVRIEGGGIPFINSIETVVLYDGLYSEMETGATYNLVSRTNLGGPEVRYDFNNDDMYNRIWSKDATPYSSFSGSSDPDLPPTYENNPPSVVLEDAIVATASDSITLTIDLPQSTPQSAYIVLYLTNLGETLKIEIDSQDQGTVNATGYGVTTVVTRYPVMVIGPTINITLSRADESSLPPIISAMEVFTKWNTDHNTSTDHNISTAAPEYFSSAYSLIILFMLFLVA